MRHETWYTQKRVVAAVGVRAESEIPVKGRKRDGDSAGGCG